MENKQESFNDKIIYLIEIISAISLSFSLIMIVIAYYFNFNGYNWDSAVQSGILLLISWLLAMKFLEWLRYYKLFRKSTNKG